MAEQSFWDMLRTKRDSLTKSGIIVADYLMQHAEDAQYLSISSLAKACGVAEATIFRFCRALGFDGYNEMKIALAKATATAMPVSLKLEPGVDTQTLCTHAYNTAIEALNGTRSALDPESVDRAATLLQRARQVFFFGQGGSYILACDIWARFSMLSTKFRTAGDSHMQAIAASLMGPEDVVVFVSYSGATRDMMDSLHLARENGAKVILLTHYSDAPGAALADVVPCAMPKKARSTPAACRSSWPSSLWRTSSSCATRWTIRSLPTSPSPAQAARWGVSCCNISTKQPVSTVAHGLLFIAAPVMSDAAAFLNSPAGRSVSRTPR